MGGVAITVLIARALAAQYKMTVNMDRLVKAQNEPQNWLRMNGDYVSSRYTKLTQINRKTDKNRLLRPDDQAHHLENRQSESELWIRRRGPATDLTPARPGNVTWNVSPSS